MNKRDINLCQQYRIKQLSKYDWQIEKPDTERSEVFRFIDHEQNRPKLKCHTYNPTLLN